MSQFSYEQYSELVNRASNSTQSSVKVGFFKLKDDGDEALVRINVKSVEDLQFASVHQLGASTKWMKIGCHNAIGAYGGSCPLCAAVAAGNTSIGKAAKKVYVQMLVAYRDKVTGTFSAPIPVIWERPAGFSREIANKLRDYGNLREVLLKITRNGKAGDMQTTYSIDYAVPAVFKPELIPTDFSAFDNFNIAKHSYWEKSIDEINTFLTTGAFPEVVRQEATQQMVTSTPTVAQGVPYVAPAAAPNPVVYQQVTQAAPQPAAPVQPQAFPQPQVVTSPAPAAAPAAPTQQAPAAQQPAARNFTGWSF